MPIACACGDAILGVCLGELGLDERMRAMSDNAWREYLRTEWECHICAMLVPMLRGARGARPEDAVDAMEAHLDRSH